MESFEQKLKDAIAQRRPCNLSMGDAQEDLADSDNWGPERTIDGGLLTRVLLDDKAEFGPLDRPLEIIGARITGYVDLRAVTLSKPVFLIRCVFHGTVDCDDARLQTISFEQSRLTSLQTRRAKI